MSVSDAQKKSRDKWDKENMATLGCKVKKCDAELFKQYAETKGKRANGILKEYVLKCNEEYLAELDKT